MSEGEECGQCYSTCSNSDQDFSFICTLCSRSFHLACIQSGVPSQLREDVLFKFSCASCCEEEQFVRPKLSWLQAITLVLYNLHRERDDEGEECFYHWKDDICALLVTHWDSLFLNKKRTPKWRGSVTGVLSNQPRLSSQRFIRATQSGRRSGTGYWRLASVTRPTLIDKTSNLKISKRQQDVSVQDEAKSKKKRLAIATVPATATSISSPSQEVDTGCVVRMKREEEEEDDETDVVVNVDDVPACGGALSDAACLADTQFTMACDNIPDELMQTSADAGGIPTGTSLSRPPSEDRLLDTSLKVTPQPSSRLESLTASSSATSLSSMCQVVSSTAASAAILEPGERQDMQDGSSTGTGTGQPSASGSPVSDGAESEIRVEETRQSVDTMVREEGANGKVTEQPRSGYPTVKYNPMRVAGRRGKSFAKDSQQPDAQKSLRLPFDYEEKSMVTKLQRLAKKSRLDSSQRRLLCKLRVRQEKRALGLPLSCIPGMEENEEMNDTKPKGKTPKGLCCPELMSNQRILDKYQRLSRTEVPSLVSLLDGSSGDSISAYRSPHTSRLLKPYIWRDLETKTPKMKLLEEIRQYPYRHDPGDYNAEPLGSIDYSYVRAEHISAVNSLCHTFFWPGVDLTESLQTPDFTCVVLYKRLVIGFAFMVPDYQIGQSYISFIFVHPEWRRAGIATFMVYHLIQSCMGNDILLHVSPTNPAFGLYHKFGFRFKELVLGFYEKYLPFEVDCKHAMLMKMDR